MKTPFTALPTAVLCFALFTLANVAGFFAALAALPFKALRRYVSAVVHAQDRAAAAFLGWSGDNTISKECGREIVAGQPCRFCRFVCKVLDKFLELDHCRKEGMK